MNDVAESYDRAAERYGDYWAPVIAPAALRLLDRLAPLFDAQPDATFADIGTGNGALALAALERWPSLRVTGIDPSSGMLDVARERAAAAGIRGRLTLTTGDAATIPLRDASYDAVGSSFVLQLVPDRSAALREMRRILRPDGWFAAVTWVDDASEFEPLRIFDELADDMELPEEGSSYPVVPFASVESAAAEVEDAGFTGVDAQTDTVEHAFTPARYLTLLEAWERDDVFDPLSPTERDDVRAETLRRWAELPASAFIWRAPVASLMARKASR